jgi:hypothetical protein
MGRHSAKRCGVQKAGSRVRRPITLLPYRSLLLGGQGWSKTLQVQKPPCGQYCMVDAECGTGTSIGQHVADGMNAEQRTETSVPEKERCPNKEYRGVVARRYDSRQSAHVAVLRYRARY